MVFGRLLFAGDFKEGFLWLTRLRLTLFPWVEQRHAEVTELVHVARGEFKAMLQGSGRYLPVRGIERPS